MDQAKQKFVKNFPFHCEISMKNSGKTKSKFTIYVNNKKCFNYTGEFPFWATNWIKKMDINETNQIFKHELDYLPFNGSMFCIEGFVIPKNKVDGNETIFDINLMHESNDISSKCMLNTYVLN
uniref:Galectin n=1 Tax=Meloidogyne hapla TaxID=6305 RepID=A0A1I8AYM2_MELHA